MGYVKRLKVKQQAKINQLYINKNKAFIALPQGKIEFPLKSEMGQREPIYNIKGEIHSEDMLVGIYTQTQVFYSFLELFQSKNHRTHRTSKDDLF